jgi:peptide/nickel transport system permease protein
MAKAALRTLASVWLALTLAFVALRVLPGNAIQAQMAEAGLGAAAIAERQAALGLDQPIATQYVQYLAQLTHADLGKSLYSGESVGEIIGARAGSTAVLAAHGVAVMLVATLVLAAGAARRDGIGRLARAITTAAIGLPSYLTGTLVILAIGLADPDSPAGIWSAALVLGFHGAGAVAQALAESIRHVESQQYIVAARARGLRPLSLLARHILRNAIVPVLPLLASQAGFLLSGTVITEVVFARPGLGRLMLDSVLRRDLPVVQGLILLAALTYGACLLLADVSARMLDPRTRP